MQDPTGLIAVDEEDAVSALEAGGLPEAAAHRVGGGDGGDGMDGSKHLENPGTMSNLYFDLYFAAKDPLNRLFLGKIIIFATSSRQ